MVGEVVGARGASLGGPYGAAKAHCCVAVDESRSSLAACCVSFYQIVCLCLSVCLPSGSGEKFEKFAPERARHATTVGHGAAPDA